MREQFLDQMELERERGITIKMQPVRMLWHPQSQISKIKSQKDLEIASSEYILNLIDTPGHIDFSYEVSRALKAVEGAILLVDATQGPEAQTLSNLELAREQELAIIPVVNKIDLPSAAPEEVALQIEQLLGIKKEEIIFISAKTGEGVERVLESVVKNIPAPSYEYKDRFRALVFDFDYSDHQGIILYVRIMDGSVERGDKLLLSQVKETFSAKDVGFFTPLRKECGRLAAGEIGYIVTNIKKPSIAVIGDSVVAAENPLPPLSGYQPPKPVIWASIYPLSSDDFDELKNALARLRLSDSSLVCEEETNVALGRGFRCGFLGMLHLEIITERIKREFNLEIIAASPTVNYKVQLNDGSEKIIYSPSSFPNEGEIKRLYELWSEVKIIIPSEMLGSVMRVLHSHEAIVESTSSFGGSRIVVNAVMPLRELMRNFFDELKSATSGYASMDYKILGFREASPKEVLRLDILVAGEEVPAFSRITSRERIEREGREAVERLKELLPRALFPIKIQARAMGRIIASETIPALKKNVTGHLYGGDRTRKMKLWEKQKKGKKKLQKFGRVEIPQEVFIKMVRQK